MSDLTDPSADRIWLCIRLNNAEKCAYDRLKKDSDFWQKVIFTEKAHFNIGGYVSKQDCRIRVTKNPHAYIEKPAHKKQVSVWCGFWSIVPFSCENKQEVAVTANGDHYRAMLNKFLFTKI